jgi:hypothetical protein
VVKGTHRTDLAIASVLAMLIMSSAGQLVVGAEISPSPDPSQIPRSNPDTTPTPTVEPSPTPTPNATPAPTPTEELPGVPYDALVMAQMDWGQLLMFEPDPAPDPTWTVTFDGGQLVGEPVDTWWLSHFEVDVPSPGALVTATVSAGPPDKFRVVDVSCMDDDSFEPIPSTVHGQSVVFSFNAVPDGRDGYICYFTFDPALLPRATPVPTTPPLPPTDTAIGKVREADDVSWLAPAILVGLITGALLVPVLSMRLSTHGSSISRRTLSRRSSPDSR